MKAIVCVDKCWGIGKNGKLLVKIPQDLQFFKEKTMGQVIVLGRKTLETFPGGRPLPGRINLVLSRDPSFQKEGFTVLHSVPELKEEIQKYADREVYCVGGASIYELLLPLCETAYVTKLEQSFSADRFFPNLDEAEDWKLTFSGEPFGLEDLTYRFCTYERGA